MGIAIQRIAGEKLDVQRNTIKGAPAKNAPVRVEKCPL